MRWPRSGFGCARMSSRPGRQGLVRLDARGLDQDGVGRNLTLHHGGELGGRDFHRVRTEFRKPLHQRRTGDSLCDLRDGKRTFPMSVSSRCSVKRAAPWSDTVLQVLRLSVAGREPAALVRLPPASLRTMRMGVRPSVSISRKTSTSLRAFSLQPPICRACSAFENRP